MKENGSDVERYAYDKAGNMVRKTVRGKTTTFAFDGANQLVSVSTNDVFAESYAYDALGRRVRTTNLEGATRHVYDESWQVIADVAEDGTVLRSYVWGEGVDRLLAVKVGDRAFTALTDVQGTVWGYADERGEVVARWTYDAWGNVLDEEVAASAAELRAIRYRFQGREFSTATGLTNFRMRWYDSVIGRWLSKDPIGLSGGLNLYAFCFSNPIRWKDLFGNKVSYSSCEGGHAVVCIQDPFGIGYWEYSFGPKEGGSDNLTANVMHGPSSTDFNHRQGRMPDGDFCVNTSARDDFLAIIAAFRLKEADMPYNVLLNNCAHMARTLLNAAGLSLGSPMFDTPSSIVDDFNKSKR